MNWGRETSPRPCTPRNERNLPRIRSLLHMAPTSQNDQPQRIERKLLAQTVRTNGQSLSREPRSREPQRQVRLDSPPQLRSPHPHRQWPFVGRLFRWLASRNYHSERPFCFAAGARPRTFVRQIKVSASVLARAARSACLQWPLDPAELVQ